VLAEAVFLWAIDVARGTPHGASPIQAPFLPGYYTKDSYCVHVPAFARMSLDRQRQRGVTEAMVGAEIARRLRVSFSIDDLVAEQDREAE